MHPALTEMMTQAYQEEKPGKPSTVRDQTSRNFSDRTCNEPKLTEESFHEAIVDLPVGRRISHISVWLCTAN
jgi:hypothetical protein